VRGAVRDADENPRAKRVRKRAQRLGRRRSSPPFVFHEPCFVLAEHADEILGRQVGESEVAHANKVIRVAPRGSLLLRMKSSGLDEFFADGLSI
jgi:hypothetical protein